MNTRKLRYVVPLFVLTTGLLLAPDGKERRSSWITPTFTPEPGTPGLELDGLNASQSTTHTPSSIEP